MRILGVDPGNKGGLAICENGKIIGAIPMPIREVTPVKKTYTQPNFTLIGKWLRENLVDMAYIELVGSMPGQGVASTFTFGFNTGGLHGVIGCLDIPLRMVMPQRWKTLVLDKNTADKDDAIAFCQQNCPDISLMATKRSKVPSDGIADAICIAVYGYAIERQNGINKEKESNEGSTNG